MPVLGFQRHPCLVDVPRRHALIRSTSRSKGNRSQSRSQALERLKVLGKQKPRYEAGVEEARPIVMIAHPSTTAVTSASARSHMRASALAKEILSARKALPLLLGKLGRPPCPSR